MYKGRSVEREEGSGEESGGTAAPAATRRALAWREHLNKYSKPHNCARCRYVVNKAFLRDTLTYLDVDGAKATWLEEKASASQAFGCPL